MHVPQASELLDIWDAGSDRDHTGRALLLLESAGVEAAVDDIAGMTIGARDRLLLDLRERLFGSRIEALDRCPACDTQLEAAFAVDDIRLGGPLQPSNDLIVEVEGYQVHVRLPTSRDLISIAGYPDIEDARVRLLSSCLVAVRCPDAERSTSELPEAVWREVSRALGEADPQADVELALHCAACGHSWQSHFDIVGYLWSEIEQFARKTLREVHILARAYGWTEDEVLALTPRRRRHYLGMVFDG